MKLAVALGLLVGSSFAGGVYAQNGTDNGPAYMPNSQFTGYGHRDLDFPAYVNENSPNMVPWCQKIYSAAKLYTISPFLVLQILEEEQFHRFEDVNQTLFEMSNSYYTHFKNRNEDQTMAATQAITDHFNGNTHECAAFIGRFRGRCPMVSMEHEDPIDIDEVGAQLLAHQELLASGVWEFPLCPIHNGAPDPECDGYRFAGVHTWVTDQWSGLDFWSSFLCCGWRGEDLTNELIFPSWGGTVNILDPCGWLEVDHGPFFGTATWQTRYLHMDGASFAVTQGQVLADADVFLGRLAETEAGAECVPFTFSNWPHIHWDFMINGMYWDLKGFTFSGYRVDYPDNPTPYDPDTTLTKGGVVYTTFSDDIFSVHCFHKDTTVELESGDFVAMKDLNRGDRVLIDEDADGKAYSTVYAFATRELVREALFVEIGGHRGEKLRLTPTHFVYKADGEAIQAGKVTAGDTLQAAGGENFVVDYVTLVKDTGVVAPLTASGTVAVTSANIVASNYAYIGSLTSSPDSLHSFAWPVRAVSTYSTDAAQALVSVFFKIHETFSTLHNALGASVLTMSA